MIASPHPTWLLLRWERIWRESLLRRSRQLCQTLTVPGLALVQAEARRWRLGAHFRRP